MENMGPKIIVAFISTPHLTTQSIKNIAAVPRGVTVWAET